MSTPGPIRLALPRRLAAITALLALTLVVGATETALHLAERSRRADLLSESLELANTLGAYLVRLAPTGDPASLSTGLAGWSRRHITETSAVVFLHGQGTLRPVATSDSLTTWTADLTDITAFSTHTPVTAENRGPDPSIQVAVPLGGPDTWGVLDVKVSTARFAAWARAERKRAYALAVSAALLLAAGVWVLVTWWVGRPIRTLTTAMLGAHGGAAAAQSAPEIGPPEFQALARQFNTLRDALSRRERESAARMALEALEERSRAFERLALAQETAAGIAHEIGTPLNTMSGHLQLLQDDMRAETNGHSLDRVGMLRAQVDRVTRIVRDGMARNAWPQSAPRPVDLASLTRQLIRFLEPALNRAMVDARAEPERPAHAGFTVYTDPDLVEQVLLNLLKNAIEALPPGGRIRVTWGMDDTCPCLDVVDDGPGLAPDVRAQLFQPFVSSKGAGGSGLGLAVSRRLAATLGGELLYLPSARGAHWRLRFSPSSLA